MPNSGAAPAVILRASKNALIAQITASTITAKQKTRPAVSTLLPSCATKEGRSVTVASSRSVGPVLHKEHNVPKEELLQFEGRVTEILPDARYRVELDNGHQLVAYTAGRMKKNRIKTLAGDRVTVEVSPYDLEKGRLIFRHKDERAAAAPRPPQRQQFRRR